MDRLAAGPRGFDEKRDSRRCLLLLFGFLFTFFVAFILFPGADLAKFVTSFFSLLLRAEGYGASFAAVVPASRHMADFVVGVAVQFLGENEREGEENGEDYEHFVNRFCHVFTSLKNVKNNTLIFLLSQKSSNFICL